MEFCDKLNFLMKLCQATNKDLANELSVDRSLISLLRTGRRGMPRNRSHISRAAAFFARSCTAPYQRQALAEMLNQVSLQTEMPVEFVARRLEEWLLGETDVVSSMVNVLYGEEHYPGGTPISPGAAPAENTVFYYGREGRREAMLYLASHFDSDEIWVAGDMDNSWFYEDLRFQADMYATMKKRLENGGIALRQLLPPPSRMSNYVETLRFMLPLYASGNVDVRYYPRLWNAPHGMDTIIVPDRCAMVTTGPQSSSQGLITMVTSDPKLVSACMEQMELVLADSRPALSVHTDPSEFVPRLNELLSLPGTITHKVSPLSTTTMPAELLERCMHESKSPVWKEAFRMHLDAISLFEEHIDDYYYLDIAAPASAERVRSGTIPIACPYMPCEGHPCYTPETYVMHLKNILRIMDTYEKYSFIPIREDQYPGYNLVVNEAGMAMLVRGSKPTLMLEMRRSEMVHACQEHLLHIAGADNYDGLRREKIKMQLRALIRELES